jgi:hypothetical protein
MMWQQVKVSVQFVGGVACRRRKLVHMGHAGHQLSVLLVGIGFVLAVYMCVHPGDDGCKVP